MINFLLLGSAIASWGIVHSILASHRFKGYIRVKLGERGFRFYRLTYNFFSFVTLLPLVWLLWVLPDRSLYSMPDPWRILSLIGQGIAALGIIIGVLQTGLMEFIGIRQVYDYPEVRSSKLVVNGLYRWVRHPLYTFGLLFIWLSPEMTTNRLIIYLGFTAYLVVGALFEERKLLREYGEAYVRYKSVTSMLIPKIRWNK